jgi:hypothetical protein
MILNGEIGRYESTRFVEQTNIAKMAFTNGLSNWAYFFGNDTVAEGVVVPEEMRGMIPTDYGRSRGIAWYYVGGFGIVQSAGRAGAHRATQVGLFQHQIPTRRRSHGRHPQLRAREGAPSPHLVQPQRRDIQQEHQPDVQATPRATTAATCCPWAPAAACSAA